MGAWGEGPLENDTAGDLEVFWDEFVAHGRATDPTFWSAKRIAELFRFLYFKGYSAADPAKTDDAWSLLAIAALFHREGLKMPAPLKRLVVSAINHELRTDRLNEWDEPPKRRKALEQLLRTIGGKRQKPAEPKKRSPKADVAQIEAFMKRAPHWVAVVRFEEKYDPAYDATEPQFVNDLKKYCFAGTSSGDQAEQRRAIIARLKCLAFVAGWMLNLSTEETLRLIEAAPRVTSPAGPQYAWPSEIFAS